MSAYSAGPCQVSLLPADYMTAKEMFMHSEHRVRFEEMVKTPGFMVACDYALLAMVESQEMDGLNPSSGWDAHSQLVGARKLLAVLKNLPFEKKELPKLKWDELKP